MSEGQKRGEEDKETWYLVSKPVPGTRLESFRISNHRDHTANPCLFLLYIVLSFPYLCLSSMHEGEGSIMLLTF